MSYPKSLAISDGVLSRRGPRWVVMGFADEDAQSGSKCIGFEDPDLPRIQSGEGGARGFVLPTWLYARWTGAAAIR
jgi:hypothetical protein